MLISKEQHWRSPAKKLEEQSIVKLQGCQEKFEVRKSKVMVEKEDTWGARKYFSF